MKLGFDVRVRVTTVYQIFPIPIPSSNNLREIDISPISTHILSDNKQHPMALMIDDGFACSVDSILIYEAL